MTKNRTKNNKTSNQTWILITITFLSITHPISPLCQLPKKEQKKIGDMIYKSLFDESKGVHDEELDGCMFDDFRTQWFEVFFENTKERKRVEEIAAKAELKKLKQAEKSAGKLMDLFSSPKPPEVPESRFYYSVLAINYKEVKPLRLPMLPPLDTPPQEPFKPFQVTIRARLGSFMEEVKRSVRSTFKNPLVREVMKPSFDPNDLTQKFIKAFKFDKEKNCIPKIEENPLHPKKLKNVIFMDKCKKGKVENRRIRFENYNKILDGDEYIYGIKLRQLEFCKKKHHAIIPEIAKRKPMFYKLYGCWYKDYPIEVMDKTVEEVDDYLTKNEEKEKKEIEEFEKKHIAWADHDKLARTRIKEEKNDAFLQKLRTQKTEGIQEVKDKFERLKMERAKAKKQRLRRRRRNFKKKIQKKKRSRMKRNKKNLKNKKMRSRVKSFKGETEVSSKRGQGLTTESGEFGVNSKKRKYSLNNKEVIDVNKSMPGWAEGMFAGINLNPTANLVGVSRPHMSTQEKKQVLQMYDNPSAMPEQKMGLWGNYSTKKKKKRRRRKKKKQKVWGWHNYHMKSGRMRNWKGSFQRKLFMKNLMPKMPGLGNQKKKPFVWPKNPAFEFSIAYNSMMTKDIFFRKDKFEISKKIFQKMLKKSGDTSPLKEGGKYEYEDIPEDKFPKYVERAGKVYKVVYIDVDNAKEDEERLKEEKAKEKLRKVKDKVRFMYLEKKRLYELRTILREIRVTHMEINKFENYITRTAMNKMTPAEDAKMEKLKTDIEVRIRRLDALEKTKQKLNAEIANQKRERVELTDKDIPKEIKDIEKTMEMYDKMAGHVQNKSMTAGQEKNLKTQLDKIKSKLQILETKQKTDETNKAKELESLSVKKKAKSPKKQAKKEALKPDNVECFLITVGMHFLSLGPLGPQKLTPLSFIESIKKEFPKMDVEGLTPKVTATSIDFEDEDGNLKESLAFIHKEVKKSIFGKIEPFVYQRWLFVREALELFYKDELKHYNTITQEEAEAKHKEYLKRKNAHFEEVYQKIKKEEDAAQTSSTNKRKTKGIETMKVRRRTKNLKRRILEDTRKQDEGVNWLQV